MRRSLPILKSLAFAAFAAASTLALQIGPASAHDSYQQCDENSGRCWNMICDEDSDDCRPARADEYQYYDRDSDRRVMCDEDGDDCRLFVARDYDRRRHHRDYDEHRDSQPLFGFFYHNS